MITLAPHMPPKQQIFMKTRNTYASPRRQCITGRAFVHSTVPSNTDLQSPPRRAKCHVNTWIVSPCGAKTVVFIHILGAVYPQILTQQRQIWSALRHPPSPSLWQNSLKSVKWLTHTRRKTSKSRIRILWKNAFLILSLSPQPIADPVRKLLHGCTISFRYTKA